MQYHLELDDLVRIPLSVTHPSRAECRHSDCCEKIPGLGTAYLWPTFAYLTTSLKLNRLNLPFRSEETLCEYIWN